MGHGLCAPPGRVAQPRLLAKYRGNPRRGRQTGVAFSLVTFFLAKQKKVTSCRATPDGFEVEFAGGALNPFMLRQACMVFSARSWETKGPGWRDID